MEEHEKKAEALFNKMFNEQPESYDKERIAVDVEVAKQCAIIYCNGMIEEFKEMNNNVAGIQFTERINLWQKVKESLNNYKHPIDYD